MNRREILQAGTALAASALPARVRVVTRADALTWTFDGRPLDGGVAVGRAGCPRLIDTPIGRATAFDGMQDVLFANRHPLAGARAFTIEALFRPDGGNEAQRWFHLESVDDPTLAPGTGATRMLFEIRVTPGGWYLDAFMAGSGYRQALMRPDRLHAFGQWHRVAQTFDGRAYRSFVDGELEMECPVPFTAQGDGRCAIGARLNRVDYFLGEVRMARFTGEPVR